MKNSKPKMFRLLFTHRTVTLSVHRHRCARGLRVHYEVFTCRNK